MSQVQILTIRTAAHMRRILVAPLGANPLSYLAPGEALQGVAKVPSQQVLRLPARSGSAAVLSH